MAALLFLFLGFHALMIGSYNPPDNLLVGALKVPLNAYVLPFFGQNWSLFAPNPGGYVASYRFRYRFTFDDNSTTVTPYIDAGTLFPARFSDPFNPLSLMREISYSCSNLAENEAAKAPRPGKHEPDPDTLTASADALGAPTACTARVALSLAKRLGPSLTNHATAARKSEVQIAYTIAAARRVGEAFKPNAGPAPPLHYDVVHVTPWLTSARVADLPARVEIAL